MNIKKPTFKHICLMHMQQLTNFPYIEKDFDALTDYGLLCKIVEYLNEVIKNNNIQNEAITELYNAFVTVKNYIDNYFENLDVQDEINNKLDEMAISGQLTDIIAQYLGLAGMITFDTVADMKLAENIVNGSKCRTLGFHSVNDVGGAYYKIRTITNDDVVDEITIIAVYNDLLVAELIIEDNMTLEQFGAYGDNTHDDTPSIIKALNSGSTINGSKIYLANFGGTLYNGGMNTSKILLKGGTYNLSGKLNYTNNIIIENVNINGNVWITGIGEKTDRKVIIKNSNFNVGELTFRLNNIDFDSVLIENNKINFYGTFWSSSQTNGTSKGNVFIKNNEFIGKEVESQSETYYCACVVENTYIEFSGNNCHDFIISEGEYSVHDGYFSSDYVYIHDNIISNLDGGSPINNALLKAKGYGKRYFFNNYYNITSDLDFPFLQVQENDSEWHVDNCVFNIKNTKNTDVSNSDNIFIDRCIFNITNLNEVLMTNSYHMNNCDINIVNQNYKHILALNNGYIKNTSFKISNVNNEITDYGCIYGYTNTSNLLENVKSNTFLIQSQFIGTIKDSVLYLNDACKIGELINCISNSRYFLIDDSSSRQAKFDITIMEKGQIYGVSFSSSEIETYIDSGSNVRISHATANNYGSITFYNISNAHDNKAFINLLKTYI